MSAGEEVAKLKAAILDIDAHATPLGEDEDGFATTGYLISVGSLHRALGLVGHGAGRNTDPDGALINEILRALAERDGLSLESEADPGTPARHYELASRLGIGRVFGLSDAPNQETSTR